MGYDRLTVTAAQNFELLQLLLGDLGMTPCHVVHRLPEPIVPLILAGIEDTATPDLTQQLIARSVEHRWLESVTLLWFAQLHLRSLELVAGSLRA